MGGAFGDPLGLVQRRALPAAHPAVAAWPDGRALVAYDVDGGGRPALRLASVTARGQVAWQRNVRSAGGADHPTVVARDDTSAIVAWTALVDGRRQVRVGRVGI